MLAESNHYQRETIHQGRYRPVWERKASYFWWQYLFGAAIARSTKEANVNRNTMKKLFLTAFVQVYLVSANTYFIANLFWPGIAIAGFGISYLWTANVRKIAVGTTTARLVYATGAMLGGLLGVLMSNIILQ